MWARAPPLFGNPEPDKKINMPATRYRSGARSTLLATRRARGLGSQPYFEHSPTVGPMHYSSSRDAAPGSAASTAAAAAASAGRASGVPGGGGAADEAAERQ